MGGRHRAWCHHRALTTLRPTGFRPVASAGRSPKNLCASLAALRASEVSRKNFGAGFIDYYAHIKEAELARFTADGGGEGDVTAWEHNEYFDLF